jgi:predicted DNA-binding transcriptional regulator AlpA
VSRFRGVLYRIGFEHWASRSLTRRVPTFRRIGSNSALSLIQRRAPRISINYKPTGEEVTRNAPSAKDGARVPRRSGVAGLFVVPKLEEVAVDDGATEALDAHTTDLLETTAIAALSALRKRKLMLAAEAGLASQARRPDRLLKAKEVAERLGMGIDWVYHNQLKLPFRVRLGKVPRFSENGLDDFLRKRQGT